jgi:hypothetical protein
MHLRSVANKIVVASALVLAVFTSPIMAQFPLGMPNLAENRLSFIGDPSIGYGLTGYRNAVDAQANTGHIVSGVFPNAPDGPPPTYEAPPAVNFYADYYITGMNNAPFTINAGGIAAAQASTPFNLNFLPAYMTANSLSYGDIRLHFGQTGGVANLQNSWNLGGDVQNTNWAQDALNSNIEYRIYAADQSEVEASLYYQNTKIITFGYTPLNEIINYGASKLPDDDTISAYSEVVQATQVDALAGHALGVAQAFMDDVNDLGGLVQLYFDTFQAAAYTAAPEDYNGTQYMAFNYSFNGAIMIIPEPSTKLSLIITLVGAFFFYNPRRRKTRNIA